MAAEPDSYLVERIHEAVAHDPRTNELDVRVTIAAGKVFLTGTVTTAERQEAVATVVRELVPDHEVHNHTTVAALVESADVEDLR